VGSRRGFAQDDSKDVCQVGANCVRPRAFAERPYEDDFSIGRYNPLYGRYPLGEPFFNAGPHKTPLQKAKNGLTILGKDV